MHQTSRPAGPDPAAAPAAALAACWSCRGPVDPASLFCATCKAIQPPSPIDHFARLGLPRAFDLKVPVLEQLYFGFQRQLHPDRFAGATPKARQISQSQAVAFNEAYETLKDPLTRATYLLKLRGMAIEGEGAHTIHDTGLLDEQMERREALFEATDPAAVEALAAAARTDAAVCLGAIVAAFARDDLAAARIETLRLKYLVKLGEEARARRARLASAGTA
ncbi:MAG: Fe-S protein assembly co-chaperone HscB [Proteobacteria bacterium]|nr:Fe-S protein assembly co-chaperone HscB [Pseudomonadota bacterium]